MPTDLLNVRSIFDSAAEMPAGERIAYLDAACAGAPEVRQRVEALLQAYENAGSFLESPAADAALTVATSSNAEVIGTRIGPYKLLQQIGEGGMGTVYMAEQVEPVARRVALKIIKPGMDSRQIIVRFEAERQALALMDHPNIAKMLDAGTTDEGRPYFVMELVKGVSVIQYCDENRLDVSERLALFITICQAVQHAHQKGIIHRDLKPTNVLVADYDNRPVAKIIDFGVAKAVGQSLVDRTMFTELGQIVGTIEYMSPEQAKLNQLDIDTRTDIYSLGVLLYELLTGETPLDRLRLRSAAFDEMLRIIREEEPPKPSTRLSSSHALPSIAANRHIEAKKLTTLVSGDLDWIVMRALEKERTRRYETATGLAEDIQRYLADEPVLAHRPTPTYRLKKFIRRNKLGVIAGTAVVAALAVGLVASTYFAATASHEAKRATAALDQAEMNGKKAEGVNSFLTEEVFGLADPNRNKRAGIALVEALDIAAGKIDEKFPADPTLRAEIRQRFGEIYSGIDQSSKAVDQLRKAVDLRESIGGHLDPATMRCRSALGMALFKASHWNESQKILESVWADQTRVLGAGSADVTQTATYLALVCLELRGVASRFSVFPPDNDRDLEVSRQGYNAALARLGPRHAATLKIENELGWVLRWRGQYKEAAGYAKEAADSLRELKGPDDPDALFARYNYAACLGELKRFDDGAAEFRQVLVARTRLLGPTHFDTICTAWQLGMALRHAGRNDEGLKVIKDVHDQLGEIRRQKTPLRAEKMLNFAGDCHALKDFRLGGDFLDAAEDMASAAPDDENQHRMYARLLNDIAWEMTRYPRDPTDFVPRAVKLATKACELSAYKNAAFVRTLAEACEAAGDQDGATHAREVLKGLPQVPGAGTR
jgi:serine/threonine protein kinase/tetratricopeptide (TPR) repeat protein